ncbi:phage tail assembly protein [Sutterella sp.]|uniref:phage tail assembly protein n=1 Tax=Sutterella sp. TaxID=1981025 RepID=UPI0026E05B7F|nr:phage tail assembly protein [Sutterella sp.]MDO5531425.1 phage tail assembly protein [Sutterella sp.]
MTEPIIFKLTEPVQYGDEVLVELTFKELTTDLIIALGFPYAVKVSGDEFPRPDPSLCVQYASRLCGLPPSVIRKLAPSDFYGICMLIMGFFNQLGVARSTI